MEFTFPPPENIHTIDIDDAQDPSVLREKTTETGTTPATEPPTAPQQVPDKFADKGDIPRTYNDKVQAKLLSEDKQSEDESDEDSDSSEDESEDESDEDSDSSDDDSTTSAASAKERSGGFEYSEVIDDTCKAAPADPPCDDDLGGEAVAATSAVAGVAAMSSMRLRRNVIIGVILAVVGAMALYYVWRKIQDMKTKIAQLMQQQEMGLNDRDVQCISTQVLQDYLKQTAVADDGAVTDDDTVAAGWTVDEEHAAGDDEVNCTADESATAVPVPTAATYQKLSAITEATSETSDTPENESQLVPEAPANDDLDNKSQPGSHENRPAANDDLDNKSQPGSHEYRPANDASGVVQPTPEQPLEEDVTETKQTAKRRSRREKKKD